MLSGQGNRDDHIMNLPAYLHPSFCHMQLEHGTRLLFSVRSLQDPSFCHDKFPSNLSLTKCVIKRTSWASVSFPLVVLDAKKQCWINRFGSYCVTYIRLQGLRLSTPKERRQQKKNIFCRSFELRENLGKSLGCSSKSNQDLLWTYYLHVCSH